MSLFANTALAWGALVLALLCTASAQMLFKHYYLRGRRTSLLWALLLFASIPPMTFLAIGALGVGQVYVLTSMNYALVSVLGWRLFGERRDARQIQGLALITVGCLMYSL